MDAKAVLLIEDDDTVREAMQILLEAHGFYVVCASNGREALDCLGRAELPAVILLDLWMPVMDGWTFRRHQRQSPAFASIPLILVSAEIDLAQQAISLGVAAHFSKPFNVDALVNTVRILGKSQVPPECGSA